MWKEYAVCAFRREHDAGFSGRYGENPLGIEKWLVFGVAGDNTGL